MSKQENALLVSSEADRAGLQERVWVPPEAQFSDIADLTNNLSNSGSDGGGAFTHS